MNINVSSIVPLTELPVSPVLTFLTVAVPPWLEEILISTPMYSKYAVRLTSSVIVKLLLALVLSSDHLVNL